MPSELIDEKEVRGFNEEVVRRFMRDYIAMEYSNRQKGRTYATCKMAKDNDWAVVESNVRMAGQVSHDYGVKSYFIGQHLEGIGDQLIVDPSALVRLFADADNLIRYKDKKIHDLTAKIELMKSILLDE